MRWATTEGTERHRGGKRRVGRVSSMALRGGFGEDGKGKGVEERILGGLDLAGGRVAN